MKTVCAWLLRITPLAIVSVSLTPFSSLGAVLTFDMGANRGDPVVPSFEIYGDRITDFAPPGDFSYGSAGGLTPDIEIDYSPNAAFWDTSYGNLSNILFTQDTNGIFELTLRAISSNVEVELNSFDLGGFPNTDYTISAVRVLSGTTELFSQSNVQVFGQDPPGRTVFNFGDTLRAQTLTIQFDASNLDIADRINIGIDNIQFAQRNTAPELPEPSAIISLIALGIGFCTLKGKSDSQ